MQDVLYIFRERFIHKSGWLNKINPQATMLRAEINHFEFILRKQLVQIHFGTFKFWKSFPAVWKNFTGFCLFLQSEALLRFVCWLNSFVPEVKQKHESILPCEGRNNERMYHTHTRTHTLCLPVKLQVGRVHGACVAVEWNVCIEVCVEKIAS